MTNTSVTLQESGIVEAINDGGPYESTRNKMMALDFATQARQMKAIAGQPDYGLGVPRGHPRRGSSHEVHPELPGRIHLVLIRQWSGSDRNIVSQAGCRAEQTRPSGSSRRNND